MRDMVLILNFDDACTRAIARGLRAEHVYCKIVPGNIALEEVRAQQPLGVILSGGVTGGTMTVSSPFTVTVRVSMEV